MIRGALLADSPEILQRLQRAHHMVVALDFDGTLAPITGHPDQAVLPGETAALLRELSASENISVVILSGRSIADLKSRIDLDCIYAGNHGLEIAGEGISFVHDRARALRHALEFACWDLEAALDGVPGVLIEDKGLTATVHYRQAAVCLAGWIEATIHLVMRPYASWLSLKPARKAWEIHPRVDWNKGSALNFVLSHLRGVEHFVICAGDDLTDEDMFQALPDAISIQVGGRAPTAARYRVNSPAELAMFLGEISLQNSRL